MNISRLQNFFNSKLTYFALAFIIIYTIAGITVSLNRYWQYQSFYYDFGFFDQAIWKVAHFQLPVVDFVNFKDQEKVIFANHFNPSIFLLSSLYFLTDRREVLLVAQALAVGISAIIAYSIGIKQLKSKLMVCALLFAYLGYVGLQNALISEFHDSTVAILPLMLVFWAITKKYWKWYFLFLLIFLGFKETFAGLGVGIGIYLLIRHKNLKVGLLTIALSVAWGYAAVRFIIPYFEGGDYFFKPAQVPFNPGSLLELLIFPAVKVKTMFYSFLTFGFLPIFDLSILPSIMENFLERFVLSSDKRWDLGMHYNVLLSPLMFIGSLHVIKMVEKIPVLKKVIPFYAIFIIFMVVFLHRFILRGPLGLFYNPVFYEQNVRVKYVDDFVDKFPKDGVIMTQNDLSLRLTHGPHVKLLRRDYKDISPDHVILNLTPGQNPNSFFPITTELALELKSELMGDGNYRLQKYAEELYIFSKNK